MLAQFVNIIDANLLGVFLHKRFTARKLIVLTVSFVDTNLSAPTVKFLDATCLRKLERSCMRISSRYLESAQKLYLIDNIMVHGKAVKPKEKRAPMIRSHSAKQLTVAEFDWPFQTALDEKNHWVTDESLPSLGRTGRGLLSESVRHPGSSEQGCAFGDWRGDHQAQVVFVR